MTEEGKKEVQELLTKVYESLFNACCACSTIGGYGIDVSDLDGAINQAFSYHDELKGELHE